MYLHLRGSYSIIQQKAGSVKNQPLASPHIFVSETLDVINPLLECLLLHVHSCLYLVGAYLVGDVELEYLVHLVEPVLVGFVELAEPLLGRNPVLLVVLLQPRFCVHQVVGVEHLGANEHVSIGFPAPLQQLVNQRRNGIYVVVVGLLHVQWVMPAHRIVPPLPEVDWHVGILYGVWIVGQRGCHVVEVGILVDSKLWIEADVLVNQVLAFVEKVNRRRGVGRINLILKIG